MVLNYMLREISYKQFALFKKYGVTTINDIDKINENLDKFWEVCDNNEDFTLMETYREMLEELTEMI